MSSRDTIFQRIRSALGNQHNADGTRGVAAPLTELPPVAEVWPRQGLSTDAMAERFAQEIQAVHGETARCGTLAEAQAKLASLAAEGGWSLLGAMDRPLCRELAAALPPQNVLWAEPNWTPASMASQPAGLVAAEVLLADTGSAVVACATAQERLLCYLPPVCVVAARADQLAEHLPAAWDAIARRPADPELRGELVLITGPSRTADIEKTLILGAHGPKRLVVIVIG